MNGILTAREFCMITDWRTLQQEVDSVAARFPEQPYLLYAMGLRLRTMDYQTLFADCLLDGSDDKKIDFLHLDLETGVATIAQGWCSQDWGRRDPPANKASDLNTAINWLLESELEEISRSDIRASAEQLRDHLASGDIVKVEVFFVHNLPSSQNIDRELGTAQRALQARLERFAGRRGIAPDGVARQASREVVDEWRRSQHQAVSVHDEVIFHSLIPPQTISTAEWHAVIISIPAAELVELRVKYGDALFSANVRDYLGSRQAARNINRQIERTAQDEPQNFWVYNNGIAVLTNGINIDGHDLHLSGIAIINGAQTTGSLAQAAARGSLGDANVLVRAIKCNDSSLVDSVIRYNNTQNPIHPWELRVIDPIQRRIRDDFDSIGVTYQLRRGETRRGANDVHYEKLGPLLSAFYGDPIASHKNKAELFENESHYRQLFDDDTHVKNLLFVYRLGNAVAMTKSRLRDKVVAGAATGDDRAKYGYFRYGAFAFVLIHVCAEVLGLWLEPREPKYKRRVTLADDMLLNQETAELLLSKLADAALGPMHLFLSGKDAYQLLKVQSGVDQISQHARALFEQVDHMQPNIYREFTDRLVVLGAND
jgi:hypothetical protein